MKRLLSLILATIALPLAAQDAAPPASGVDVEQTIAPATGPERYDVLVDNNIFVKDRYRPRPAEPQTPDEPPPPPSPEQINVLTGIVFEHGAFRAYFENTQTGQITPIAAGEPIAHGMIAQIMIDSVAYQSDEGLTWIDIGQNLTAAAPSGLPGPPASRASSSGTGGGDSGSSDRLREIEERMRRAREEGR